MGRFRVRLRALERSFLGVYDGTTLSTRTRARTALVVLVAILGAMVPTGIPPLVGPSAWGVKAAVVVLFLFFPFLLWRLRQGHQQQVVLLYSLFLPLLVTVPQLSEALQGYDPLKLERFSVQIVLQMVVVSAITEKMGLLLLSSALLLGGLTYEAFGILAPRAGEGSLVLATYTRCVTNLALAGALLLFLQQAIHRALTQVEEANANLENKVEERTHQLQQAQQSLVEGERLAVLGRLASSVAHEINTPLGAIQASSQTIRRTLRPVLSRSVSLFSRLEASRTAEVLALLDLCLSGTSRLQGIERRHFRRNLAATLEAWGVQDPNGLADHLVDAGLPALTDEWRPVLTSSDGLEVGQFVSDFAAILRSGTIIDEATDKASQYILALRRSVEAQTVDQPGVPVDLASSIDSVLTLFRGRLKPPVTLERHLEPQLLVLGNPGRLMQAWGNLLSNALDSMPTGGLLRVASRAEGNEVLVVVGDSGSGIPPDLADRIFEPFVTTKTFRPGGGLGLGLVKSIVEEHSGTLAFESGPQGTTWFVRLPHHEPSGG